MAENEEVKWYYRPWVVILLILLVLGPFGLPLVYKSPKFNRPAKIIITILSFVYMWYLIVLTLEMVQNSGSQIAELRRVLNSKS